MPAARWKAPPSPARARQPRRSRRLFVMTETDENDIAAAAIIGLSCQPVNG